MALTGALRRARQVGAVFGLALLAASGVLALNLFDLRTQLLGEAAPEPRPPATTEESEGSSAQPTASPEEATIVRSAPWWQSVATLQDDEDASEELVIDESAMQWRIRWECESGDLVVTTDASSTPLVDTTCPGHGTQYGTETGDVQLDIEADGSWEVEVVQQLDVPLEEPPMPEMAEPDATVLARGTFYDMDQTGRGEVIVYELPDGTHALRLEDFYVTPDVDLEIRLSPQERPETTEAFDVERSEYIATLEPTTGSMNFRVPDGIDPTRFESVVIWCPPIHEAYSGATLSWSSEGAAP